MLDNCFTIGRAGGNDLYISEPHVSRFHARFIREPDGLYIENLSNSSHTSVNGVVVNRCRVSPGDRISLSDHYQLDWKNPQLRAWLAGRQHVHHPDIPSYQQSPGRKAPVRELRRLSALSSMTSSTLWLVLGIFFFVSYFIPIDSSIFFWHTFESSAFGGITTLYIALAGLAMIAVAYSVEGVGRAITLSSIGFVGLVMFIILMLESSGYVDIDLLGGGIFGGFAFLTLLGMLVLNNVTCHCPAHNTVRLIGGIFASVYAALATFVQVLKIINLAGIGFSKSVVVYSFILSLLFYLCLLTAAVMIIVNIKRNHYNQRNASIAERLSLWGILAQVVLTSLVIALGSYSDGGWMFFLFLRLLGFLMGLALLFGGGLADLIKITVSTSPRI